ncbi:hypothetical protein [Pseudonocardia acidicola]|uniref:Uncharacterized protein n=1 Tax=Pseudonocardia acidicola TaxID=2724939 RepID=A0ABX1S553_9PSEU|nr:hypothetical protein [Pseudonocardia acidicola]NMH96225.1 hypothetical protein [Pseudonocardia acidicola]
MLGLIIAAAGPPLGMAFMLSLEWVESHLLRDRPSEPGGAAADPLTNRVAVMDRQR